MCVWCTVYTCTCISKLYLLPNSIKDYFQAARFFFSFTCTHMYMTTFNCIQCAYTVNRFSFVWYMHVHSNSDNGIYIYKVYLWYEQYLNNCMYYLWYSIFSNAASTGLLQVTNPSSRSWLGSYRHFRLSDSRFIGKIGGLSHTALLCGHTSLSRRGNEGLGGMALVKFGGFVETHLLVDCITGMFIVETWE